MPSSGRAAGGATSAPRRTSARVSRPRGPLGGPQRMRPATPSRPSGRRQGFSRPRAGGRAGGRAAHRGAGPQWWGKAGRRSVARTEARSRKTMDSMAGRWRSAAEQSPFSGGRLHTFHTPRRSRDEPAAALLRRSPSRRAPEPTASVPRVAAMPSGSPGRGTAHGILAHRLGEPHQGEPGPGLHGPLSVTPSTSPAWSWYRAVSTRRSPRASRSESAASSMGFRHPRAW